MRDAPFPGGREDSEKHHSVDVYNLQDQSKVQRSKESQHVGEK